MKKKLISLITAAVMALGISVPAMAADAKPMEGKLVVVHTNDMHGYYETTETSIGIAGVAGLKNYSAKDLRHSYAAISLLLGADKEEIQKQLGWSDKYYAIRYKNVIDFVDSESIDYMMQKDNMNINKK